ncbi:MAG: marine proteobacterial sortase target protein [Candidatus Sedimenticola sp. (ex Thyasira tokunagai)]
MSQARSVDTLMKDMLITLVASISVGLLVALFSAFVMLVISLPVQAGVSEPLSVTQPIAIDEVQRGSLLLKLASGGVSIDAPQLSTDVVMNISGMSARVKVKQRFRNPGSGWVEGVYVFPLPENAAVDRMRLRIGERLIEGEIQERMKAEKIYRQAKLAGKKASLLSQERPNIFTTAVANIAAGEEVTVEIEYQQTLRYDQGRFSIRYPLVVAPRYIPGIPVGKSAVEGFSDSGWADNTDQVTDASRITPSVADPSEGKINPLTIQVNLAAGLPLARLESTYHSIETVRDSGEIHRIKLKEGTVPADRDFELTWVPQSGRAPSAALFTEEWRQQQYALLMLMPPLKSDLSAVRPDREVIFVIDTSGSMHGDSIAQAKGALKLALQRLTVTDRFNIISFNHQTHALFGQAVAAKDGNLHHAIRYVDGLEADGGTEMLPALEQALAGKPSENTLRQVVFLTDGSVGNEEALFSVIQRRLGESRLFTIGIGSAPNSHFMIRAAEFGRGAFTYIGKVGEVKEKMSALFAKLESPVLTDINLSWSDTSIEIWPQRIPDLYLGEPVVVAVRLDGEVKSVEVSGRFGGKPWHQRIAMDGGGKSGGIHLLWARSKIADLMAQRSRGREESEVRDAVLDVALEHQLVSRYTSLVAVERRPVRPQSEDWSEKEVPTNLPQGWSAGKVFGQLPQTATPAALKQLLGLLLLLMAGGIWWLTVTAKHRRLAA